MLRKQELGQTAVEYALIVVAVSLVMIAVMTGFATELLADADAIVDGLLA